MKKHSIYLLCTFLILSYTACIYTSQHPRKGPRRNNLHRQNKQRPPSGKELYQESQQQLSKTPSTSDNLNWRKNDQKSASDTTAPFQDHASCLAQQPQKQQPTANIVMPPNTEQSLTSSPSTNSNSHVIAATALLIQPTDSKQKSTAASSNNAAISSAPDLVSSTKFQEEKPLFPPSFDQTPVLGPLYKLALKVTTGQHSGHLMLQKLESFNPDTWKQNLYVNELAMADHSFYSRKDYTGLRKLLEMKQAKKIREKTTKSTRNALKSALKGYDEQQKEIEMAIETKKKELLELQNQRTTVTKCLEISRTIPQDDPLSEEDIQWETKIQ